MPAESQHRPVQVLLDTKRFIDRATPRDFNGGAKDFFEGNDVGFEAHKLKFRKWLQNSRRALESRGAKLGFIHVQMRDAALGKSYRPLGSLFTKRNGFAQVGAGSIGEMIFQASPDSLGVLDALVESRAELTVKVVPNKETGEPERKVSKFRSEVGAVSSIELHDATDRVPFSAEESVAWLSQEGVIGGYIVELFNPSSALDPEAVEEEIHNLVAALDAVSKNIVVKPFGHKSQGVLFGERTLALSARVVTGENGRIVRIPAFLRGGVPQISEPELPEIAFAEQSLDISQHQNLLNVLAEQSLVRGVELPPLVESAPATTAHDLFPPAVPKPVEPERIAVLGIVDGGVAKLPELVAWCAGESTFVPDVDRDESHATFIAGLVAAGAALNPNLAGLLEGSGCRYYDLDLFPRKDLRQKYFGGDIDYFFDVLEEKIKVAKGDCGVRIFNLSMCMRSPGTQLGYSVIADRLDRLARANDVIFVVSAGNLKDSEARPPWSSKAAQTISMLAGSGGGNQQIVPPAEHLLGLTVGAVNPPGVRGHEPHMPTNYTRRGPGVGGSRKPDLAHYGGAHMAAVSGNRTGLLSLDPNGGGVENCGTSFASPVAAASLAVVDHRLEHAQPREVLLALPIHRAERGKALSHASLRHISREFVGFGIPPHSDLMLADSQSSITLVFSEVLHGRQVLEFPFAWPASLVGHGGSCRGEVEVTLAFTPPIDQSYKDEALRVLLDAHLYQEEIDAESRDVNWVSRLTQDGAGIPQGASTTEKYLLRAGLKWSPIKRYVVRMPNGRGSSSNWKLTLDSLARAGAKFPLQGVGFAILMTLSDPRGQQPVHDEVRNSLQARGVNIADISIAHRIRSRG